MIEYKIKIFVMNILKLPVNASIRWCMTCIVKDFFSLKEKGHELDMKWLPAVRSLLPDVQ